MFLTNDNHINNKNKTVEFINNKVFLMKITASQTRNKTMLVYKIAAIMSLGQLDVCQQQIS
jgi:hypothetical protein